MKYYIRTTGERKLHASYSQIPYVLLVDEKHYPISHFIESLFTIDDEDSVLLEDDLILCKDFINEIEKAIALYPGRIINFFQNPRKYQAIIEQDKIIYNQCTFYPKGVAREIASFMEGLPRSNKGDRNQYSLLEEKALQHMGLSVIQYRPCLVQHLDQDTMIFPFTFHTRRTPYFLDYLNELEVSYEEANNSEVQNRLEEILIREFQNLNNEIHRNKLWKN